MCIAMNSPKGTTPTKDALKTSFENNPHGAGFAFAQDGKIIIEKGFMTFDSFYSAYQKANIQGLNKLIHFRIKTSGQINYDNCHPFKVTDNLALIHNGVIPHFGGSEVSDTREFIEMVLRPIIIKNGLDILTNQTFIDAMSDMIGGSKLAFLDSSGKSYFINESLGHTNCDIWYSNNSYTSYDKYVIKGGWSSDYCNDCGSLMDKGLDALICEFCDEDYEPESSLNRWAFNRF